MDFTTKSSTPNPREKAGLISKLFFWWIFPLLRKGHKNNLNIDDVYDVLQEDDSETLSSDFAKLWDEELGKAKLTGRKSKLVNSILSFIWARFLVLTFMFVLDSSVIQLSQTLMLRFLIQAFQEGSSDKEKYIFASGVVFATLVHAIVLPPVVFETYHIGMQCRVAISNLIYKKALRLSASSQGKTTVGQLVNILSNDINRFDTNVNFIPWIVVGPIQLIIFGYFLWRDFGYSTFSGLGAVILLIPVQYFIGKYSTKYRSNIAIKTDERGRIMSEITTAIRVIKMYAWEKAFSEIVDRIRKLEVKEIRKRGYLKALLMSSYTSSTKIIPYSVFVLYIFLGNNLHTDKVFFALACFNIVIQTMTRFVPTAIVGIGELMVAVNRIEKFLHLDEQISSANSQSNTITNQIPKICMENVNAKWTENKFALNNMNLLIEGDKLLMVIGPVGSGKTSFLHSLISELPIESGRLLLNGKTSYASQEPWIFAGNLRQNILFGLPFEENRYQDTIEMCALLDDLKQLPHGDMTVVGERGVALSGGQKARVNLARCLYRRADIYLMDDPLSAVDTRVSRFLFEKCIREKLEGSLRVLVTHQLQYLNQADHILVLDQGSILAQGSYEQLLEDGIDFVSLVTNDSHDEANRNRISSLTRPDKGNDTIRNEKQLVEVEKMTEGSVTLATYLEYFRSGGHLCCIFLLFGSFIISQFMGSATDYWLSIWTNTEVSKSKNDTFCSMLPEGGCEDQYLERNLYIYVYSGLTMGFVITIIFRSSFFFIFCTNISINLHNKMFKSLVTAPLQFFDDNPSGRIMNRFTKDVGAMDELLPTAMYDTADILLQMIGVLIIVIASNYFLGVPILFLFIALGWIRNFFIHTARDIKRIESISRSPLFTQVSATMQGIATIRSLKVQDFLIKEFNAHQNRHSAAWYLFLSANRWFAIWLDIISVIFLALVTFSFLGFASSNTSGNVGLAITSVLSMNAAFQWGMRQSAETENFMTSVERALEYSKLKSEAPLESKEDKKPPSDWPKGGEIQFQEVFLAYDKRNVLKNLSFEIKAKEKIGIVGRTGAGKSSIIAALFRMTEPSGDIFIDGVKINDIGLHDLRKNISIIPQDPVLFSGTIRYNLDPFGQFSDDELWSVIKEVELKDGISSLDFKVSDGGSNFSLGERQLVCLGRAILRKNKIIVMDEATANVDPRTDSFIQETIKTKFIDCSIITIAHRLQTVINSDRIAVLDNGNIMEYDHPYILLQNKNGHFSNMVKHTGKASETILQKMASEAHETRDGHGR